MKFAREGMVLWRRCAALLVLVGLALPTFPILPVMAQTETQRGIQSQPPSKPPPKVCPRGMIGKPPVCVKLPPKVCPQGTVGKPPNCRPKPPKVCPQGMIGKYPDCRFPEPPKVCPKGTIGKYPNCKPQPPKVCPRGMIGKYPNCRYPEPPKVCPKGTIGKPPKCAKPEPQPERPGIEKPPPRAVSPVLPPPSRPIRVAPGPAAVPPLALSASEQLVPDEVLATVADTAPTGTEDAIALDLGLIVLERVELALTGERLVRWRIPDGRAVADVVAVLAGDGRVSGPQPNYVYSQQGGSHGAVRPAGLQYALDKINLSGAHQLSRGRGSVVAIIDSGIDTRHPDLAGASIEEVPPAKGQALPEPVDPHGTAVAAIIAARGLVQGIAPEARILSIRAFQLNAGTGRSMSTTALLAAALEAAAARRARIINMSFAGREDPLVGRLVAAVLARDILLVAAAGNKGADAPPAYPAAYPGVIAVTATDARDAGYIEANRGSYIAMAAPGVDVLTAGAAKSHQLQSGTSMAAAHVSGILALMLERNPDLSPDVALAALATSAVDLGLPGPDPQFGAGRVNAFRALQQLDPKMSK